jgi:tetratricopeptide (TPR) repeat protein
MRSLLYLLVFTFSSFLAQGQNSDEVGYDAFAKANQAYTAENFKVAIKYYQEVLDQKVHSVETYFNLANAYYKNNEVGPAIYYYEKALQLDPDHVDVLNNLSYAHQLRIDAIEPLPENSLGNAVNSAFSTFEVDEWAWLSIVFVLIALLCFALYYYAITAAKKRLFFVLTILFVMVTMLSIGAGWYQMKEADKDRFGIIMEAEFTTREEPKKTAAPGFVIHEGTKIQILEQYQEWSRIALENGNKAWIPNYVFKEL